jgi:hypothetical protein
MPIKIISVKAVGLCSKHRIEKDEVPKYKDGTIIPDKELCCVGCELFGEKK